MFTGLEPQLMERWFWPASKNHLNVRPIVGFIEAQQRTEFNLETGLFGDFAVEAFMNVLVMRQVSPRQVPMAGPI